MPDFVDPPELQNAPICSGSLRPKTDVQKHAHRYCVKSSSQPNQCSSQPDRSDYLTGKKSATKRSADKANEKKRYSKGFWKAIQCRLGIPPTGKPGPETRRAIMSWQDAHGKPTNGVINDRILNDLGLSANQLRINPKTVTLQQLRERLGENYTPSQHFDHGPATIALDRNNQLKCPALPANHQPSLANYSFADAPNHFANLPHSLETLGIAALRGNPLWNAKPESSNRARQPQSSDALAPNDANHAIVERLKSPENYHIERETVLSLDTVDGTIAKRLIILENFNTKANGEAWEELVQYAQSDSTEAHQVMQSVVDYVIKELHKLESQGDRKEAAVRHIHASDKHGGDDEAAVVQDKLLWLKERERVSKWLLGLSKLYQDPAFAALAFQGTHYAGLEGTVIDEQTGHPIRVPNEALAIQSKKSADSFAQTGNMSNIYRTGAVCNEFAYASSSIANPTGTKNAFPISISKSNWYSPALVEQERYKTNFDDIEQGDAIVALNPRQNDKSRKNDNPPSLEELSKYTGRHVDIVVAVSKRNPPKKKKGNKADREQDEQSPQKAVMLAGARGSNFPNGIHTKKGNIKWYFSDDDKFKQPFIVIKSVRKHHSIDLSSALTQDFKYDDVKSDIAYNINSKHLKPAESVAIFNHIFSDKLNTSCQDRDIGYQQLLTIMKDIPSSERDHYYVSSKNKHILMEFKKELEATTQDDQKAFLLKYMRNNIQSKEISFDTNVKSITSDFLLKRITAQELYELNTILINRPPELSSVARAILIYRSFSVDLRDTILKGFTSTSSMHINICPILPSSISNESERQIATKNIWRSKHP